MARSNTLENRSLHQKHVRPGDMALRVLIYLAAALSVAVLVGLIGYILV